VLKDRLRTSAVLIAVAAALLALDANWAPAGGEGLFLIPLLLFFALGTAWDVAGLCRLVGIRVSRRYCLTSVALISASPLVPTLWATISAASDGRLSPYPVVCPVGRLGWPVLALTASAFACFLIEMVTYPPVRQTASTADLDGSPTSGSVSPAPVPTALANVMTGIFVSAYVGLPMSLLVSTRTLADGNWGLAALLTLIATTKSADAGAYFSGKTFGRRKLIPRLSPGKTWEGVLGGILMATAVAAACLGWGFAWLAGDSAYAIPPLWLALLLGPSLALAGVVGDLSESMVKRECGAKDSGSWLPGLGGMWDVSDSLLAAVLPGYLCFAAMA